MEDKRIFAQHFLITMSLCRILLIIVVMVAGICQAPCMNRYMVVADSASHTPLASASVFNYKGTFIGTSSRDGSIRCASTDDFPLLIRYMGYFEKKVADAAADTIFLSENITELPEVVVEAKDKKMLHVVAYVREYSSLSSYTDTVSMYREKVVDFMLPGPEKTKYKGWRLARVLDSHSYYQFMDGYGLDSVSDRCNHHFSWSDWMSPAPEQPLPAALKAGINGVDTVGSKYGAAEIWNKNNDRITIDIDVLADSACRRWVPEMAYFLGREDVDFEKFMLRLNYGNPAGDGVTPLDLAGFSCSIESRGRGRQMFMFNREDKPFFVASYIEVYILDKRYISVRDAKKMEKQRSHPDAFAMTRSADIPELQPGTLALIDRVRNIDTDVVRQSKAPNLRMKSNHLTNRNFTVGNRVLNVFKNLTGISEYKFNKNTENTWKEFRDKSKKINNERSARSENSAREE